MKNSINYQTQLNSCLENEINQTELKKSDITKLQKQYRNLSKQASEVCSSINASLEIINTADYGEQFLTSVKKLNKTAKKLNTQIEGMITNLEHYASFYQGRTKLYYQASELFQTLNKTYNLNFKANIKTKGRLIITYNPLLNPKSSKQAIGAAYYLFIQKMGQAISSSKLKGYQDNQAFRKIKMNKLTKANRAKFKSVDLVDLNGKALEEKYNYRAYLLVKIDSAYKKQLGLNEDFVSIGSYPFSINNQMSDYSLKSFYQEFNTYKNIEEYIAKLYQNLNDLILKEKAANPLISDELIDTITTGNKKLEQLHKSGLKSFEQLLGLTN